MICVGSKKFYVYCVVLVLFSLYFFVMFIGGMVESYEESVVLKDVDCKVVELFIDFVYIGKFDIMIDMV